MNVTSAPPSAPPLTFKDLAMIAWRRKAAAAVAFAVALAVAMVAVQRITPLYEAQASLTVDRSRQAIDFAANPEFGTLDYGLLNIQKEMLLSRPVLERAYQGGLTDNPAYEGLNDPVALLSKRVFVKTNRDSWVIQVSLRDEDRDRAKRGLDALVQGFMARQSERIVDRSRGAVEFLTTQTDESRKGLEEARQREKDFRREKGIQSIDPNQNELAQRLNGMIAQKVELERQIAGASAIVEQLHAAQKVDGPAERVRALLRINEVNANPLVAEQQQQLYAMEGERVQLAERYLEKHPRMLEIEQRLNTKRQQLEDAVGIVVASSEARARTMALELETLSASIDDQSAKLTTYRADLISLFALGEESLQRQRLFDHLSTRLGEEQVASRLEARPVSLLNPATASNGPVNVQTPLLLLIALVVGSVAALATAMAREALDRRVRGVEQIEELTALPVLGSVPRVDAMQPLGRGGDADKPQEVAEAYRGLRAAIHLARRGDGCRRLVVTSASEGEGKSTVATRLAISLAAAGARVLLVDADMRKPSLHHQVGEADERGLSFLLAGYSAVSPLATSYANLDFLGVGVRPPNPSELLHSPALEFLLERSRDEYQFIVVDTPPLGVASDALLVTEHADGVLLVVRDRVTLKSQLRRSLNQLDPFRGKLLGVVLNGDDNERAKSAIDYGRKRTAVAAAL